MKTKATYLSNIKAERVRAGLTQEQLAKKLGISATSYNLKETGARHFTVEELMLLAAAVNSDPESLLKTPLS